MIQNHNQYKNPYFELTYLGGDMNFRKITMMMITALFILTIGTPVGFCADVAKIGIISFQKIFENSTGGQAVQEKIKSEGQLMEQDLKQKSEEINALKKRLDSGVLEKSAREEQQWELGRKIDDVKALKKKYDRKLQEMNVKLVQEVQKDVLKIVHDYGKKQGFLLIVEDITAIYAPQQLDITDDIIKIYNDNYAKQGKSTQGPKG